MKTCPICKSTSFDDMEICFGCMHRFDEAPYAAVEVMEAHEIDVEEPKIEASRQKPKDPTSTGDRLCSKRAPSKELQDAFCSRISSSQDSLKTVTPVAGNGFSLVISIKPLGCDCAERPIR